MIFVVFVICLHNRLTSLRFEFGCSFMFAGNQDLFLSINKVFLFSPDFGFPVVISALNEWSFILWITLLICNDWGWEVQQQQ